MGSGEAKPGRKKSGGANARPAHPNSEELCKIIFKHSPIGIINLSTDGVIVDCNEKIAEMMGATRGKIVGFNMLEDIADEKMAAAVRKAFAGKLGLFEGEYTSVTGGRQAAIRAFFIGVMSDKKEFLGALGFFEDITEQWRTGMELRKREHELKERVKELNCLYTISSLAQHKELSLNEFLRKAAEAIPPAWQYPEITSARILVEDREFATVGFDKSQWRQACRIISGGVALGEIEVCYSREMPPADDGPFLKEESLLLKAIADLMAEIIENKRSDAMIMDYQRQLRYLASELSIIEERERKRIAALLHDNVGHVLAIAKIKLQEYEENPVNGLAPIIGHLDKAVHATRWLTFEISPPVLHELSFEAALGWLVRRVREEYGLDADFFDDGWPKPLDENARFMLFRSVQELLVNVVKHAKAKKVTVAARRIGGNIQISVEDDGVGFDYMKVTATQSMDTGFGLFSIRERVINLGGSFEIKSSPGLGTAVYMNVPVRKEERPTPSVVATGKLEVRDEKEGAGKPIRILIADDQKIIREGLTALLDNLDDIEVAGQAKTGIEAVELTGKLNPDVVVMDVSMPDMNGIEATAKITADFPGVKVIALSMHTDGYFVMEMLKAGASGYLLKDCAQSDLAQAIRTVKADLTFLSHEIAETVVSGYVKPRQPEAGKPAGKDTVADLTPRETEVLVLITQGLNTKEIARKLGVSVKTIEAHRQNVMDKLEIRNLAELTKFALREGLTKLD